ncbi:MAG: hypothetical protein VKK59_02435, partial [Vampirovibrionales bacterium]|nr:hypothetical protein [Vampirovibrionales bacterium]
WARDVNSDMFGLNTSDQTVEYYIFNDALSVYQRASTFSYAGLVSNASAIALDQAADTLALLDAGNKQIDIFSNKYVGGAPTALSLAAAINPTGLAIVQHNGNYLVLDSALQTDNTIRLMVYNSSGLLLQSIAIDVTAASLGVSGTSETNWKIHYNDADNLLYLLSPSLGRIFGLSLPRYL